MTDEELVARIREADRNWRRTYSTCPCGAWFDRLQERPHVLACPVESFDVTLDKIATRLRELETENSSAREMLTWTLGYIDPFKHVAAVDICNFLGVDSAELQRQNETAWGRAERLQRLYDEQKAHAARLQRRLTQGTDIKALTNQAAHERERFQTVKRRLTEAEDALHKAREKRQQNKLYENVLKARLRELEDGLRQIEAHSQAMASEAVDDGRNRLARAYLDARDAARQLLSPSERTTK